MARLFLLLAVAAAILISPAWAQRAGGGHGGGPGGGHAGGPGGGHAGGIGGGGVHAPPIFRGGARGPVGWDAFHHDTAPARVAPHRMGGTNLPRPNGWHGNIRGFDLHTWQGGGWQHVLHNGQLGWWWVVGPDWYYFNAPIYPYPDLYTPYDEPFGWWYWCDASQEYYPYVTTCAVPWEPVMPRP